MSQSQLNPFQLLEEATNSAFEGTSTSNKKVIKNCPSFVFNGQTGKSYCNDVPHIKKYSLSNMTALHSLVRLVIPN